MGGKMSELLYSPAAIHGVDLASATVKPRARANPMMAVCGNTMYLYGGVVEVSPSALMLSLDEHSVRSSCSQENGCASTSTYELICMCVSRLEA